MERRFRRTFGALEEVFAFVERCFEAQAVGPEHLRSVSCVIEELFTNIVKYSVDGESEILLSLKSSGDTLTVALTEFDVEPFDIRQAPPPELDRPIAERAPGGLGIHLVRELMDSVDYHYENRTSTTTVTKRLR
jgi:anti-sigma regulatory factor (Ser/Thr protein kinase)